MIFGLAACQQGAEQEAEPAGDATTIEETTSPVRLEYPNIPAEVVFENDHVIVQDVTAEPGTWSGEHGHDGNNLLVVIEGGTVTFRENGEETTRTYEAGHVELVEAIEAHDHMVSSDAAMRFVAVAIAQKAGETGAMPQAYPDQSADVVYEDDRVIVQHLIAEPGTWSGEHAHAGNQIAIALTGATVTYRENGEESELSRAPGEVFEVEATEGHDHMVAGDSAVETILLTLK